MSEEAIRNGAIIVPSKEAGLSLMGALMECGYEVGIETRQNYSPYHYRDMPVLVVYFKEEP